MLFSVKDGAANIQNIRTEEIELVDDDDVPPPVPDTPRRIQFDRNYEKHASIAEDDDTCNNSSFKSKKTLHGIYSCLQHRCFNLLNRLYSFIKQILIYMVQ